MFSAVFFYYKLFKLLHNFNFFYFFIKKIKKKYIKSKSIIEFTYENIVLNKKTIISLLKEFKKGGKYDK